MGWFRRRKERKEFEDGFDDMERDMKVVEITKRYMEVIPGFKNPAGNPTDEEILAGMLMLRVIGRIDPAWEGQEEKNKERVKAMVAEMSPDAAKRAAAVANRRCEEWLEEIKGVVAEYEDSEE